MEMSARRISHYLILGLVLSALPVAAGMVSEPFSLDIESGNRVVVAEESLSYDSLWQGVANADYRIQVNGVLLSTGSGAGDVAWHPAKCGTYTLTYQAFVDGAKVGDELTSVFILAGKDLVNADITFDSDSVLYDGTPQCPKPTIVYLGEALVEGLDYTLEYGANVDPGVGIVTVKGMGKYVDLFDVPFTIRPSGICFLDIESGARTAAEIERLTYDCAWHGDAASNTVMKILTQKSDAGSATTLVSGLTDSGAQSWQPTEKGQYTVTLRTYVDGVYLDTLNETAVFNVIERTPAEITQLLANSRYPWNGMVDVDFTIGGDAATAYEVSFAAKDLAGGTNLVMKAVEWVSGGASRPESAPYQLVPGTYRFVWNAAADLPDGGDLDCVAIIVEAK